MIGWTPPPGRDQTGRVAAPALVGRARQLAALRDALARAVTGEGGVLVVRGDPGIGKSALIEAAMGTVDVARFVGHAVPEWVQAGPGGGGDRRRGPRRRRPPRRPPGGPVPAPRGGADRHRPGRAGRGAGSGRVRPVRRRRRGGLLRLLELAADRPATVFEDLYWADPDTRSVVEYLADHIHGRPAAVGDRASRRSSVARTSEQLTLARTRVKLQPRPAETVPGVLA